MGRRTLFRGALIASGLVLGIAGSWAWAAIPDSGAGRISACYEKSGDRKLRLIDSEAGERCRKSENSISWQQRGMRFRGAWAPSTSYTPDDVVTEDGSSFVAIAANTATQPPNLAYWTVLAAEGPPGPTGPSGPGGAGSEVVTVPVTSRIDLNGSSTPGVAAPLVWSPIAGQDASVTTTGAATLKVTWWASTACFGVNRKYARILVDGTVIGNAPLTNPVGHTSDFPSVATEASISIQGVASVSAGTHAVTVEAALDTTASCVIAPAAGGGGGLLTVEVVSGA